MRKHGWTDRARLAVLLALCSGGAACADMAMPAAPRPEPVNPLAAALQAASRSESTVRVARSHLLAPGESRVTIHIGGGTPIPAVYVVDGRVMTREEFTRVTMNPAEVANIEIVRDAAVVQRYGDPGARAAVILTTTRAVRR